MAKKQQSKSDKEQFSTYNVSGSYSKNKLAKIARHLKRHPNDEKAVVALKHVGPAPTRKVPTQKVWSTGTRELSQMLRRFGLSGHFALRSLEQREQHLTA